MKKLLLLLAALLVLTACFGKKAAKPGAPDPKFALLSAKNKYAAEFLAEKPGDTAPEDLLFVRVKPGTITVGSLRCVNDDNYFILTQPVSKKQLAALAGAEDGEGPAFSVPFAKIEEARKKLDDKNKEAQILLPTTKEWDFAFLSGKIEENAQPFCWEWAVMEGDKCTWRGRTWHIMEMEEADDEAKDKSLAQENLGFRFVLKDQRTK